MRKLKITIDPLLLDKHGPEICWTWRLLLTGMGFCWEEVPYDGSKSDIAYVVDPGRVKNSKLVLCANATHWDRRSDLRLATVKRHNGLQYPTYEGESIDSPPFCLLDACLVCRRDFIFDTFWLATGQEEKYWHKDRFGICDLAGNVYLREGFFMLALASGIASWFEKKISTLTCSSPTPRWPGNKQAAACLSHDVDYPEILRWLEPFRIVRRMGLAGLGPALSVLTGRRHHWHFQSWVEMEKNLGVRSAFYFVACIGSLLRYIAGTPDPFYDVTSERYKNLFKYLIDEGFEIGLHASYCACNSQEKLAEEKHTLELASREKILGNRHHYWRLHPDDCESTLMLHEMVRLKYDTSLTHDRYLGWRRGLNWPFFPFYQSERRELRTLQIPTAWMDAQILKNLGKNYEHATELLRGIVDRTIEHGGVLLIDVHNYVFDDVLYPGWARTYHWLVKHLIDLSVFWITTPAEVADYSINRYKNILDSSLGLRAGLL